jgi:hypothetical protein
MLGLYRKIMSKTGDQSKQRLHQKYPEIFSAVLLMSMLSACQTSPQNPLSSSQGNSSPVQTSPESSSNTSSEPELSLAEKMREVPSPVGRMIQKVFIPALKYRAILLGTAFAPIAMFMFSSKAVGDTVERLRTQDYRITITQHCPEGYIDCDNVTYQGLNVNTGETIQLNGRSAYTLCADEITPCNFIGYEFHNGEYLYVVTEAGGLQVYRGSNLLINESGTWQY